MKAFAIITAALMATGGAIYFYSHSECAKSRCTLPVAKSGGCCSVKPDCCSHEEQSVFEEVSSTIAVSASGFKTGDCCGAKEECCLVRAACCTAEKASAVTKSDDAGCCAACITPTLQVTLAAKSIASAK